MAEPPRLAAFEALASVKGGGVTLSGIASLVFAVLDSSSCFRMKAASLDFVVEVPSVLPEKQLGTA
jgi:hypothetical protein